LFDEGIPPTRFAYFLVGWRYGKGHTGEAMIFNTGLQEVGKMMRKYVADFLPEEIKKKITISTAWFP
jgi:hypothetical protein